MWDILLIILLLVVILWFFGVFSRPKRERPKKTLPTPTSKPLMIGTPPAINTAKTEALTPPAPAPAVKPLTASKAGESFDLVALSEENRRDFDIVLAGLINLVFRRYAECGKITRDELVMNMRTQSEEVQRDRLTQKEWEWLLKPGEGVLYQAGVVGKTTDGRTMLTDRAFKVSRGPGEETAPGYQGATELVIQWLRQNKK